jgi:prephenate dehydrogenase
MLFDQITIVGVGLIGGSVGLAVKHRRLARRIVGTGREPKALARAAERGAVDDSTTDLTEAVRNATLVVVCTPVDTIADVVLRSAPLCRPGTIFTDGGSTKHRITSEVEGRLPTGVEFVPAHPLAGSEKNGVANARADLFENRLTILTPGPTTDPAAVDQVERFWQALGSRVTRMDAGRHDRVLAGTSHLPHLAAAAVAGIVPADWLPYSATGFRDTTRVAGGDPEMWAAILSENETAVCLGISALVSRLQQARDLLEAGDRDGLVRWLAEAKRVRDALGT